MDTPKNLVKREPRKSLLVLLVSSVFSLIIGIVALMSPGAGQTDMAENVGWVLIVVGLGALMVYVIGRKEKIHKL
ncbi:MULTISPECIES: DUF308 domain-containing protein [Marinobacter]|uniref:DUF308 domain-containing protein n=1 Tax=Marinobacter TaxID=2742 RepID=UPI000DAB79FB|nr:MULTISPECIES: DUF308 domain-containing protein [Marinobacter]